MWGESDGMELGIRSDRTVVEAAIKGAIAY